MYIYTIYIYIYIHICISFIIFPTAGGTNDVFVPAAAVAIIIIKLGIIDNNIDKIIIIIGGQDGESVPAAALAINQGQCALLFYQYYYLLFLTLLL